MSLFATLTEDGSYALTGAGYTAIVLVMLGLLIAGCFITKADEKAKTGTNHLTGVIVTSAQYTGLNEFFEMRTKRN